MIDQPIRDITILGGGTAGWMAAAAVSERFKQHDLRVRVIESPDVSTVGVGEATVPGIQRFHHYLGIKESEFVHATGATFKLGIAFQDWARVGHSFFHPFSSFGVPIGGCDFYQCWLKLTKAGYHHNFEDYSLCATLARQAKFAQPDDDATSELAHFNYAYHFDAGLYAKFLRNYAQDRGVEWLKATVTAVNSNPSDGSIQSLTLSTGEQIDSDFFIDCTGFRSLLLGEALDTPFVDWSDLLPCDSAVVVQSENNETLNPYTISYAQSSGWRWRIPLEHRAGNGYVYSSAFIDDDSAREELLQGVSGDLLTEPRVLRFKAGMRQDFWRKNCIALGLASGFIEPLESTSISLIQSGIEKFLQFMPDLVVKPENIKEANRLNRLETEWIRDFIVLHYISSGRKDTEFWRYFDNVRVPSALQDRLDAFQENGQVLLYEQESFVEPSWLAMYHGFGRIPLHCAEQADRLDVDKLQRTFCRMRQVILEAASEAQSHRRFLQGV